MTASEKPPFIFLHPADIQLAKESYTVLPYVSGTYNPRGEQMKKLSLLIAAILTMAAAIWAPAVHAETSNDTPSTLGTISVRCLADKTVGVVQNSVQHIYLMEHCPELKLQLHNFGANMMLALKICLCDAAIIDEALCYAQASYSPNILLYEDPQLPKNFMGMAFNHSEEGKALCRQFNEFLSGLRESGELEAICDKWILHTNTAKMPQLNVPTEGDPIIVGMEPSIEPIAFIRGWELLGLDAELIYRFAAHIGRPVKIETIDYYGLLTAVAAGQIDIAASGFLITAERGQSVLFSDPYYVSRSIIATRNDGSVNPQAIPTTEEDETTPTHDNDSIIPLTLPATEKDETTPTHDNDSIVPLTLPATEEDETATPEAIPQLGTISVQSLHSRKLGVLQATVQNIYLTEHHPELELQHYNFEDEMLLALERGDCDAAIMDDIICFTLVRKKPNILLYVDSTLPTNNMGMAFNHSEQGKTLCRQFNEFLMELRNSGELEAICEKWSLHSDTAEMPKLNIPTEGEPIIVGIEPSIEPIAFMRGEEIVGLDAELIYRFAAHIGRPVKIENIDYYGLLTTVATGRIDIATSGFIISAELGQSVLFSDPYYVSRSIIVTRNDDSVNPQNTPARPAN